MEQRTTVKASTTAVIGAFAAIYVIWGSTYLAIRIAIETLPPFLMAGTRFLLAGGAMYAWVRARSRARPTPGQWVTTGIIGVLLLLGGNGGVTWAEQTVPSGIAALFITSVPIWMVLLNWQRPGGVRPTFAEGAGVVIGFSGVAYLLGAGDFGGDQPLDRTGGVVLILASLSWTIGSLYSRHARLPESQWLSTGMEMLTGGAALFLVGLICGEASRISVSAMSLRSVGALLYLTVFGSLIGFSAYVWLLTVSTPARVSTYAFVNPVVAVLLGCVLGGEPFSMQILVAAGVIVGAVVLITAGRLWSQPSLPAPSTIDEKAKGRAPVRLPAAPLQRTDGGACSRQRVLACCDEA